MAWQDALGAGKTTSININLTDSAIFSDEEGWGDALGFNQAAQAALTVSLSDSIANLLDSLTAVLQLRASLSAESAANLADALDRILGLLNSQSDGAANFTDAVNRILGLLTSQSDSAANLSDALAAFFTIAFRGTDDANTLNDPLIRLIGDHFVGLPDDMNQWGDVFGARHNLFAALGPDSAANLLDEIIVRQQLLVRITDDAANLTDVVAKFLTGLSALTAELTDNANTWNDTIAGRFEMFAALVDSAANLAEALNARLSLLASLTDNANNWNDSTAALRRLFANLGADNWANLTDSISASTGAQLFLNLSDAMGNLVDTLAGARGLLAASTDSAANLADSAALRETLSAQLTDAADDLADALAGFHQMFAKLDPDSAANLLDAIVGSAFSVIFYIYAWTILGPEFVLGQAQPVFQGKELSAEYTLREAA